MKIDELVSVLGIPAEEIQRAAQEELQRRDELKNLVAEPWLFQRDMLCVIKPWDTVHLLCCWFVPHNSPHIVLVE